MTNKKFYEFDPRSSADSPISNRFQGTGKELKRPNKAYRVLPLGLKKVGLVNIVVS